MGLRECLISAADQGAITRAEAADLADSFEERYAQNRLSMGDDVAKARARQDLEAELRAEALEKKRRADLTEARRRGVACNLNGDGAGGSGGGAAEGDIYSRAMALLSHYGFRSTTSVRGRTEAIIAGSQAKLDEVMFAFERRGLLGQRANRAMEGDVVRELHGEASGDATARYLARSITSVFEDLRQRFNAAGGAIGRLEDFGLPHSHDRLKVRRAGREGWKEAIAPLLDPARMTNPLTGQPLTAAGLDASLDHVYSSIASENRAHLTPTMQRRGRGSIANQRQDERFLQFRDAAGWLAYHRQFGRGDVIQAIFHHVNGMARDIAAMEVLGPNPGGMVEYMKQMVAREIGQLEAGLPSLAEESRLFPGSQARLAEWRLDSLWGTLRGAGTVVEGAANLTASTKNFLLSAQLGSTAVLAASTDPFVATAARKLAGLPATSAVRNMIAMLRTGNRREIIRSGVIWGEYLNVMHDELRFAGPMLGAEWTKWLADRAMTWSGLTPLTTGRKLVEARAWQSHIADQAGNTFAQLDPRFRRALEGFGVTNADWEIWRGAIDPAGFVTPREIERVGGPVQYLDLRQGGLTSVAHQAEIRALRHREAAEKLSEIVSSWSERSVPGGTPNARSVITGAVRRGTFTGEVVDYLLQYKSFGLSFTTLQLEAIGEMAGTRGGGRGLRSGIGYFAPMAIMLTVGGAAYLQIKALLDGKQPESMNPKENPEFWVKAGLQGGGFGLFGDFVKSSENRFGQSPTEAIVGPGFAFLGDSAALTIGNLLKLPSDEKQNPGREARKYLQRYTPVLASHWATRFAYNRLVLDNLQWMIDPEADKSFKAQARLAQKNGSPFLVEPGSLRLGQR